MDIKGLILMQSVEVDHGTKEHFIEDLKKSNIDLNDHLPEGLLF